MNKKGFTILEVILAISILTTTVFAGSSLIHQIIVAASLNQSKLVAYYLGQEGIEIVKNTRDNNWLNGSGWNQGMSFNEETGIFANFKRKIIVEEKNDGENDYLEVGVVVSWSERGRDHSVEVINHLYNWYGN